MIGKKEKTRELIIDVSYTLFAKDGFNKITMKDICDATNMSRGGLYNHFSSTREIFEALLEKRNQKDEMNFYEEMKKSIPAIKIMVDELVNVILYAYQGVRMWSRIIPMPPDVFTSIRIDMFPRTDKA